MDLKRYTIRDYRTGFADGVSDTLCHPILIRRALFDDNTFKKIIDDHENSSNFAKGYYLHPEYQHTFDDRKLFASGYRTGANIALGVSISMFGSINILCWSIDKMIQEAIRRNDHI